MIILLPSAKKEDWGFQLLPRHHLSKI